MEAVSPTFSEILTASVKGWRDRETDQFVLSAALPVKDIDPLTHLPLVAADEQFRFLWDLSPDLCIGAAGQCQYFDLTGPGRFDMAQRFSTKTFENTLDITKHSPCHALPRILLAFSFFEQINEIDRSHNDPIALQAVLPRWQLSKKGNSSWLRLTSPVCNQSDVRELVENLWIMREKLFQAEPQLDIAAGRSFLVSTVVDDWESSYKSALSRGIELVNSKELDKLVLAVRQSIQLKIALNPLAMLYRLRTQQLGSCRFLWQRNSNESFFGASPERLVSLYKGQIKSDALAGTATQNDDGKDLLKSDKDLREHALVVEAITQKFYSQGLKPQWKKKPQLARQGHLIHLHTPITARSIGESPLHLVSALHPTPAVAGLPCKDAMSWLKALEPFERGNYAAPIGWMDSDGNADFRVAIRCGYTKGKTLSLIAGAGLVKGSCVEAETQEVGLKFAILASQLDLQPNSQRKSLFNSSMT